MWGHSPAVQRLSQGRKVRLDDVANRGGVNAEVASDEQVPKAADLGPWDLRELVCHLGREVFHRLPDHLQVSLDGVHGHR